MVHTIPVAAFVLHQTKIGKRTMNQFGICSQRRSELFLKVIFLLSIGRAAMNVPMLRSLHKGYLVGIGLRATVFVAPLGYVKKRNNIFIFHLSKAEQGL
jgi:hypothetical protein